MAAARSPHFGPPHRAVLVAARALARPVPGSFFVARLHAALRSQGRIDGVSWGRRRAWQRYHQLGQQFVVVQGDARGSRCRGRATQQRDLLQAGTRPGARQVRHKGLESLGSPGQAQLQAQLRAADGPGATRDRTGRCRGRTKRRPVQALRLLGSVSSRSVFGRVNLVSGMQPTRLVRLGQPPECFQVCRRAHHGGGGSAGGARCRRGVCRQLLRCEGGGRRGGAIQVGGRPKARSLRLRICPANQAERERKQQQAGQTGPAPARPSSGGEVPQSASDGRGGGAWGKLHAGGCTSRRGRSSGRCARV